MHNDNDEMSEDDTGLVNKLVQEKGSEHYSVLNIYRGYDNCTLSQMHGCLYQQPTVGGWLIILVISNIFNSLFCLNLTWLLIFQVQCLTPPLNK
mmetsp:Transcript_7866/g.16903  ORF Transcript_7866/g.16903 Transcript_7866/m.16903 type:complete len:94 (-) Transcript_7866:57-338(-)